MSLGAVGTLRFIASQVETTLASGTAEMRRDCTENMYSGQE